MRNDVECPYCGADQEICHDDGQGYAEDEMHQQECSECDKVFVFTTAISFNYSAKKADCLNGGDHDYQKTIDDAWDTIKERDKAIAALKLYHDATVGKESERERQIAALTARLKKAETALKSIKEQFDKFYRASWIYIMPIVTEGLESLGDEFQRALNKVPYEEATDE